MTKKNEESPIKKEDKELKEEKRKFIFEIIKVRLEGITEATKRARITFIISIIASCSMLITLFNTYYSWTQTRGFDNNFKYRALKINNVESFLEKMQKSSELIKPFDEMFSCKSKIEGSNKNDFCIFFDDFKRAYQALSDFDRSLNSQVIDEKDKIESLNEKKEILIYNYEKVQANFLNYFNERILSDSQLYLKIENKDFFKLFKGGESKIGEDIRRGEELKNKISRIAFSGETPQYYDATNHLNKLILQKQFREIEWKAMVGDIGIPISLYEENKRALSKEWIENQNVRINLLGIAVNVDQFSLIGSFTLMVISIWMLFSFRRENRSIVSLLRDVKKYVKYPKNKGDEGLKPHEDDLDHDDWKIADLALHGIAHNLIFAQTGKNDLPMSEKIVFHNQSDNNFWGNMTEIVTKLIRKLSTILIFLPAISIVLILWVDYQTTTNTIYPYSNNPIEYFINRNVPDFPNQISYEIELGVLFLFITIGVTFSCLMFQNATSSALRVFEKQLGKEVNQANSWWENIVQTRIEEIKKSFIVK